jgi:hypothetical protein
MSKGQTFKYDRRDKVHRLRIDQPQMNVGNLQELAGGMSFNGSAGQLLGPKEEDENQDHLKTDHLLTKLSRQAVRFIKGTYERQYDNEK